MLELFIEAVKTYIADNTWNAFGLLLYGHSKCVYENERRHPMGRSSDGRFRLKGDMPKFKSPFFWWRFKKNPILTIGKLKEDERLKFFFKAIALWITVALFIVIALATLAIFEPQDGLHVRDQMTGANKARAMGLCSTIAFFTIMFKVFIYRHVGFIKSVGDFKLRMILW